MSSTDEVLLVAILSDRDQTRSTLEGSSTFISHLNYNLLNSKEINYIWQMDKNYKLLTL